ncbi:MAG TPA: TonB-dependent receptor, partial [Chitinophagaceae bacterium]|nr:TonB-dependent receptor [Chitinophagaceae bacterium]
MRHLFFLLSLFIVTSLTAQTTVKGVVKDAKSGFVPGVSIALKDTYDGATTDSLGQFSFKTTEKGDQTITATAIGYKAFEQKVTLNNAVLTLEVVLKEEITELKAVVISAGTFEASDRKKATVLSSIDILTTASANADVTGALKTLPGAQQVGESEGLFVRGGTAAETKTFIDGTLVNNFFYSSVPGIAQRGRFSPWFLKGTVFSAGGYSALYGQALSSAVILETVDLPEQSSADLGISILGASAGFQHLAKDKKSSWGVNYAYTSLWLAFKALKQKQQFFTIPEYHTVDANFRIKTSNTGFLKYYGYFSANKLGFRTPSIDSVGYNDLFRLRNTNMYHNLSYREALGNGWKMSAGLSFSNNKDDINGALQNSNDETVSLHPIETKNFTVNTYGNYANAKVVVEKRLSGLSALRLGSEYNYSSEAPVYTLYTGEKIKSLVKENLAAAFAETDIYITNNIAAKVGARAEHSSMLEKFNLAPRVSVAYKLNAVSQASVAYGIFYQSPESRYLPTTVALTYAKAIHYIAQYQVLANDRTFRAEVYYKKYEDLLKTTRVNSGEVAVNNNGYGEAKGFEIFWRDKKTIKNFDYW